MNKKNFFVFAVAVFFILISLGIYILSKNKKNSAVSQGKNLYLVNQFEGGREVQESGKKPSEIANPASVFCLEHGGDSQIQTNLDGSQTGYCVFSDGSQCEEWAFYRGECRKNSNTIKINPDYSIGSDYQKKLAGYGKPEIQKNQNADKFLDDHYNGELAGFNIVINKNKYSPMQEEIIDTIKNDGWEEIDDSGVGPTGQQFSFKKDKEILVFTIGWEPMGGWDSDKASKKRENCAGSLGDCFGESERIYRIYLWTGITE